MCVVALAYKAHPRWQLLLAGNRDEFHARDALPLARWQDEPQIIAGRDVLSGGSWLGISEAGRLAVITNVRSETPPDPAALSRGVLVSDMLRGKAREVRAFADYNAFNLLVVTAEEAHFATNRPAPELRVLTAGIHALSNGVSSEPWPRKQTLEAALAEWLGGRADQPEALLDVLADDQVLGEAPPLFIRDETYGTRCSTVVAVDAEGEGRVIERRFMPGGRLFGQVEVRFQWPRLI